MRTILAMAVGPTTNLSIGDKVALTPQVRRYIEGLIDGLTELGHTIGQKKDDYMIEYKERQNPVAKDFTKADLIFGMSTTVVRAAAGVTGSPKILGIVSARLAEGFNAPNIACFSARRSQKAADGFRRFLATVPSLEEVYVLHKRDYGPSERALRAVKRAAKRTNVDVITVEANNPGEIDAELRKIDERNPRRPADRGVFVSPADVYFSNALRIIELAQTERKLPTFFPDPGFVRPNPPSALGAYGVSQYKCGRHAARLAKQILWTETFPDSEEANDNDFEWVVSNQVATDLNIEIPSVI